MAKLKIKRGKRERRTCKKGHVYYTKPGKFVTIDICPTCWNESERVKK